MSLAGSRKNFTAPIARILTIDPALNRIWRVKKACSRIQRVFIGVTAIKLGPEL